MQPSCSRAWTSRTDWPSSSQSSPCVRTTPAPTEPPRPCHPFSWGTRDVQEGPHTAGDGDVLLWLQSGLGMALRARSICTAQAVSTMGVGADLHSVSPGSAQWCLSIWMQAVPSALGRAGSRANRATRAEINAP